MSYELIALLILGTSFLGMAVILYRKIPVLTNLPKGTAKKKKLSSLRFKKFPIIGSFSYELFLQKLLSKIRILSLKTENKTNTWLEKLRQKANQKNTFSADRYWEELKKAKRGE